ncbi:hypothetical protein L4C33_12970 [Vibrio makurazakiensis]|uniref:hypothetical protein n=1 Tax=Vibrio makurazakiensis TaxID=2910250 RepID=UPI003D11352A
MFEIESIEYGSVLKSDYVCFYNYPDFTHVALSAHHTPLEICIEFLISDLQFGQRTIGDERFHTVSYSNPRPNSSDGFTFTFDDDQELEQFCAFYGLER